MATGRVSKLKLAEGAVIPFADDVARSRSRISTTSAAIPAAS